MIRAVLDTSVLVPRMTRSELREQAALGRFTAIWSPWIIAELYRTLTWNWLVEHASRTQSPAGSTVLLCDGTAANRYRCAEMANRMMALLLATPHWELVDPRPPYPSAWDQLRDIWDHPIWAAAVLGQVQYVVSNNLHDYPPPDSNRRHLHAGVEYLSAQAFLDRLDHLDADRIAT
jgi:hypothetical protein